MITWKNKFLQRDKSLLLPISNNLSLILDITLVISLGREEKYGEHYNDVYDW